MDKLDLQDITILSATFNRHDFTLSMIKSWFSLFHPRSTLSPTFIILDNSTDTFFPNKPNSFIKVVDNTNYKNTPNFNQPSKNHASSIAWAMQTHISTRYLMLCDNDILFKPSIVKLLALRHQYDIIGEIGWDRVPPARIYPYWCMIDMDFVNTNNISYFDESRCMIANAIMDTGCSFYVDSKSKAAKICPIKLSDYIIHLKGGTLRNKPLNELLNRK